MYNQFDGTVEGDENVRLYDGFCDPLMKQIKEYNSEQKKFCLQLIRNLGCYPHGSTFFDPSPDNCKILQYWIYNSIRKHNIPNKIITESFDDYKRIMRGIYKISKCDYHSYYDNYKEPMNIILLDIFQYNMNIVKDIVSREHDKFNLRLQEYICECVKIYKEMNQNYCLNKNDEDQKRILTCSALKAVKKTYESFLSNRTYKNYKIPSLDNVEKEYKDKCMLSQPKLRISAPTDDAEHALPLLPGDRDDKREEFSSPQPYNNEKTDSSISSTVSTAIEIGCVLELEEIEEELTAIYMLNNLMNYFMMDLKVKL
ncbi:hypothetical protein PVBG_05783 [Plasmodium vivax Brazil I]|uniref:PIR Superfamily Protein n=1 Tax=Plasmodium vivax (strain Brazil I) TaxID=1033975 RepID=A0A0J9VAP9_PLAV1|nr:hypothetical protein PVBG_05783 [Plasmodium vivax Brazil I]